MLLTETRTSFRVIPIFERSESRTLTTLRCAISTPLGQPADPEVYMT